MDLAAIPFAKLIGITPSNNEFIFELVDDVKYTNHLGTVAAAAQFSLAEFASGQWMINTFPDIAPKVIPVLRKSEVKFKKPAFGKIRAKVNVSNEVIHEFTNQLTQSKRALISINVIVVNDNDEAVMHGTYEWFIQLKQD
jgi:hypothetical protein